MKTFGTLIVLILLALGAVAAMAPRHFELSREVVIARPPEVVFSYLRFLNNLPKWNAWFKLDPACRFEFQGADGEVGAIVNWQSEEKDVGVGSQRLSVLNLNQRLESVIRFSEPFAAEFTAYNELTAETDGRTKVVMGMQDEMPFPDYVVSYIVNVVFGQQAKIADMMDESLKNLKWELESAPVL
jgi:hypothetical protein